jgi:hypothetical protein
VIGYDVVELEGRPWRRLHGALVPQDMPHVAHATDARRLRRALGARRIPLARWESDFDGPADGPWWHLIKDRDDPVERLPKKARYGVRRGLREFAVRRCGNEEVRARGHAVYRAAYARYETFEPCYDPARFSAAVAALPPETEFWCVEDRDDGRWSAFAEVLVRDGAACYVSAWFDPAGFRRSSSYALFHVMNRHYLGERGLRYVSDGARSISHDTGIHDFLTRNFGFRRAYARLHVVYAPGLGALVAIAFPLRGLLGRVSRRAGVLLEQERLRRACAREGTS